MQLRRAFLLMIRDATGATAVEYGMILAVIVLVALVGIQGVADETTLLWQSIATKSSQAIKGN